MVRRLALAVLTVLAFATAARAGDYAERAILGFSTDGRHFAFEEFGVQDGSGFPYSNIYVVDISADDWVEGSPFRVLVQNEATPLAAVRAQARQQAQPMLGQLGVSESGQLVASNPVTEASADPYRVAFQPRITVPMGGDAWSLALSEISNPPPANCPDVGQPFKGYRLTLDRPGEARRTLHEDNGIPGSRNCPLGYGISDVLTYPGDRAPTALVVILNLFQVGFEGPNRRFLAVTATLP